MPFADHDDVVKAFPSNRTNHSLGIRVLPRRARRNNRLLGAQCLGLTRKSLSIDLVSVPNQIPRRLPQRARLEQLPRRPFRRRGCAVTFKCTSRRLLWVSITSTNSTRKVAVGTVKKSNAMRSLPFFIGAAHPPNQSADLAANPRPTASGATLPRPVASESLPVPADHRLWPYHLQRMLPTRPQPRQRNPEDSVHLRQPWAWLARLPDGKLLP